MLRLTCSILYLNYRGGLEKLFSCGDVIIAGASVDGVSDMRVTSSVPMRFMKNGMLFILVCGAF